MAAAAVPSGPGDEEVVGDFLQQFGSPQEALDYIKENFDPFQADPRWAKVRGLLGAAQAAGGTMEDVRGQLFPKQLQAETGLTRAEISAEVRREANRSRAGLRVWETLFKSGDAWKRERARAADAMARLDKQITARLATGGGTWEEKLGKTAWSKYEYKLREKVSQTNQDFIALETGITSLREALARYTAPTAGEYEKQKAYSDFTQTVESMLGTIAKANDEGKRISDKDADRFRGALKPFLLDVGPDAWARLDPAFALERLDFTEKRFTEVRDAKVKEFHDDWKRGPGGPPPPPPPEPEEPGGPKKVKTQAEVDALPAGALFIWTDGKTYTKD
jgi:hypothetical protein